MRKLLTLILSFLIIHSASAYEFNSISTSNSDISYDGISYICQDSRGFMWIGTYKGLNRYDGYSFVTYDYADLGLESDFIHIIVEDKEGNLWVGTDQGVSIYYYKKDHFEPFLLPSDKNVVIQNKVTYIMVDEDGSVWLLANEQGCFNYNCQTGELKSVLYDELGISGLRRMARSEDGRIWVSRYHSNLYTTADNFNTIIPVDLGSYSTYFEGDEIEGLFPGSNGRLYVASYKNGLSVINTINKSVRQLFALPPTSLLQQAFFDKKTAFWLATSEGLYSYDLNSGETIKYTHLPSDPYTISNDYTTAVYVDSKDGVWVGTKDSGLNYAGAFQKNFEKQYIAEGESLRGSLISGFAEDAYGRIWIASEEKGLLVYDPTTHKTSFFKNPLLPLRLCAVCIEGDILWCGTHQGLFSVNVKSGAVKNYGVLKRKIGVSDPHVYMLFRTSGGDLYAGTTLGVFKYCPEQDIFVEIERFSGYFPTAAAEQTLSDGSKRIWFSTYANGLLCWNPNGDSELTIYNSKTDSGLSNNKMSSVFIDSKNDIWAIGFTSGFYKLHKDTGKFVLYDGQTLPSQLSSVYFKAVEDDRASLWLSSDVGLVEYNQKIGACLYTPFNGLLDSKLRNCAIRSSNGDMYFGSENGFIRFNPSSLTSIHQIPSVVISSMKIMDKEVDLQKNIDFISDITLKKNQNSFGFNFSIPGISVPALNNGQCRLVGYEEQWRDIMASRSAYYYNVPAGHYFLQIRVLSKQDGWVEAHSPLTITIQPGFWASVWGLLSIFAMVLVFFFLMMYTTRRAALRKQELAQKEYRKAKDEELFQDKMNFFSHVIHEIKTPLALIKAPLSNVISKPGLDEESLHDMAVMRNSTDYLSTLVNELLDYVRIEKTGYSLNCSNINIVEHLQSLLFNYSDTISNKNIKLSVESQVESATVYADPVALDKILNNLLINAVKYAESYINISIVVKEGKVIIRFANNGDSIPKEHRQDVFKPFVQLRSESASASSSGVGIGLPLAKNLTNMHSGTLELEDTLNNEVSFLLTLPLTQAPVKEENEEELPLSSDEEKATVLIADDNTDFADYIASKLKQDYKVITVNRASAAMSVLKEKNIDILLTDISMPGQSGLDLSRQIRADIEISHIPIIIISARSSVESKIQAMQAGANLYIEKPFDLEYLRSSVKNILDQRILMKNAFNKGSLGTDIDMFNLPKPDEILFRNFDSLIRENLINENLGNEFLAERLNMSQSTLVRKIKKMLNTSPNSYIKNVRMSVAAEMIKNSRGNNITEISYMVGFSSLSYFTKCFKEHFGVTPSEMAEKNNSILPRTGR